MIISISQATSEENVKDILFVYDLVQKISWHDHFVKKGFHA